VHFIGFGKWYSWHMNNIGFLDDLSNYFISIFFLERKEKNITGSMESRFLLAK
jgi:hypothetical protein